MRVSSVRTPRAKLLVGGMTGAVFSAEVANSNYWAYDPWKAVVALSPDPQRDIDFWGSQDEFEVDEPLDRHDKPRFDGINRAFSVSTVSQNGPWHHLYSVAAHDDVIVRTHTSQSHTCRRS
jgi:hypothetical protein